MGAGLEAAEARLRARDPAGAAEALRAAITGGEALDPLRAVRLAQALGDVFTAVEVGRRHVAAAPDDAVRVLWLADLTAISGDVEGALAMADRAAGLDPGYAEARYYAGTYRAQLGDFEAAIALFREAAGLMPELTPAWEQIAPLKRFAPGDPDLAAMQALDARLAGAGPETRGPLLYALGKAYDDLGETGRAFDCVEMAGRLLGSVRPYDPRPYEALAARQRQGFDRAFIERQPRGSESERPIFVMGLPRSGTTLVEQVLTSHSAAAGGGEINLFRLASLGLGDATPQAIARWRGAGGDWARLGEDYLALLERRFGPGGRIVDKTLNNTLWLGAVHLALPRAPLVWVTREPADVAWSCFRNNFVYGQEWTYSLAHIARHMRAIEALHAHWRAVLGDALLTVPYEALVEDFDGWAGRILRHCGLEWEDQVRDFHASPRAVATASLAQVRQPISDRSIGAWRRYADRLGPFFEAYGDAG